MGNKQCTYDQDFLGWTYSQADFLREGEFDKIDLVHLIEEMVALGNSEKSKLESHLTVILLHLLKKKYQPEKETRSWSLSIENSKYHASRTLKKNPSLKHYIAEILEDAYFTARLRASQETGIDETIFPRECPWVIESLLK